MDYAFDVLVIAHDRLELTMSCILKLYQNTAHPFHLIVVDDSTDLTPLWMADLQREKDNITYLHSDVPYKSGNQIFNLMYKHSVTPYMVTVMNSIQVEPDWPTQALGLFEQHPEVGLIGFKCLFPDGRIESAGITFMDADKVDIGSWVGTWQGGRWANVSTHVPVDVGSGAPGHWFAGADEREAVQWAFAMIRKEAYPKEGLDEDLFNGFVGWDDIDDSLVIKKAGWKIVYCGQGVGYHQPRATRGNDGAKAMKKNEENAHIMFKRWGYWRDKEETRGMHNKPKKVKGGNEDSVGGSDPLL